MTKQSDTRFQDSFVELSLGIGIASPILLLLSSLIPNSSSLAELLRAGLLTALTLCILLLLASLCRPIPTKVKIICSILWAVDASLFAVLLI